jgi:hypothetical protein
MQRIRASAAAWALKLVYAHSEAAKVNPVEFCVRSIIEIKLEFQGILWAFWNASRLGLLIHDAERKNGNTNIRFNRIMQRSPAARAGNH